MSHAIHTHSDEPAKFPLFTFLVAIPAQLALTLVAFRYVAPGVFFSELANPGAIVLTTILLGIPLSLFEYLYHRYLLHSSVLPFLGVMHDAHATHHGLTNVKAPVQVHEPAKMVPVKSDYPVEHVHQEDSMMFPLWGVSIFQFVFFLLISLPLKLAFPAVPAFTSMIIAVTLYYSAYELWHAVLHLSFDRVWKHLMAHRAFGGMFRHTYGFHLMHHWRPTANLAVVGFWGVALWDHLFRTHHRPTNMPLNNAEVNYHDAAMPKPRWPISMLDKWQKHLYRGSRRIERFAARTFLRRRQPQ